MMLAEIKVANDPFDSKKKRIYIKVQDSEFMISDFSKGMEYVINKIERRKVEQ